MKLQPFTYEMFLSKWENILRNSNIQSISALLRDLDYMVKEEREIVRDKYDTGRD